MIIVGTSFILSTLYYDLNSFLRWPVKRFKIKCKNCPGNLIGLNRIKKDFT